MIGHTVSHYKILEKLGGGGMGVVYKAEDTTLKRTVALKFLPPNLTQDPEARERFIHEAQAASALEHANICSVHEIAEHEGQTFIVMGYYEGKTLKWRIENGGLKIEEALDIALQLASGLARAHEAGIIHRDIKPANVMVTDRGEVKIVDFGLAKLSGGTLLTRSGSTLGTAAYMAPEQARGGAVDARADIWSLGVVLYEMLAGRRPFESDYEQALTYLILSEDPKPLRQSRPEIPEVVEQIVQKALAKDPEERYQSAEELVADLNAVQGKQGSTGTVAAAEAMARRRRSRLIRRVIVTGAIAVVLAVVFLVVIPFMQERALASNPRSIAVISFENQTGDKSQDYVRSVLQDAIITSLEQSKYMRVTTRQRIADILKQMGKKDVEYVDNELGLELCRRDGAQLMAVGTFAKVGDLYRTTLKLIDAQTLETVKTYSSSGKGVESLLETQVDDLSRQVARGIGVSERKTVETIRPVAQISTTSIEAYRLYLRALQEWEKFYFADARPYLEMAVQKDSMFASAWYWLANARRVSMEDPRPAAEAQQKARALAWKASEKEQCIIALYDSTLRASLLGMPGLSDLQFLKLCVERFPREKEFLEELAGHCIVERNPDEAIPLFLRALELDPTYGLALCNLAYAYAEKEDWDKSLETFNRYAEVSPGDANVYDSMGDIYKWRGMYDQAATYYRQALALKSNWFVSAYNLMWCDIVKEKYDSALKWADTCAVRGTGHQSNQMWGRAFVAFWQGRLTEAERLLTQREAMLNKTGKHVGQGQDFLNIWIAYERRQLPKAKRLLESWAVDYDKGRPEHRSERELFLELCRGYVDLGAGNVDSVAVRLAAMDSVRSRVLPSDTTHSAKLILLNYTLCREPLRSEWLMAMRRPEEALASLSRTPRNLTSRIIDAVGGGLRMFPLLFPVMVDVLPRAFLATGQLDSAAAAYERAVDLSANAMPIFPRYHYRLAQVYERKGSKSQAIAEYEKFLKIWGKADPIYKEVPDAKARLRKLRNL